MRNSLALKLPKLDLPDGVATIVFAIDFCVRSGLETLPEKRFDITQGLP